MSDEIVAVSAVRSGDVALAGAANGREGPESNEAEMLPVALSVGQQLCAAREAKNLSLAEVAKMLKLSAHQIAALEGDDWSRLPVTVVRGFVRNYARLLNIAPDPLMQALSALQMPSPPTLDLPNGANTTLPETGKIERRDYAAVFSGLFLVVVAVVAYFFFPQDLWLSKLTALTAGEKPSVVISEKPGLTTAEVVSAPAEAPRERDNASATALPAVPVEASTVPGQQSVSRPLSSGLKLGFAQPSWVEIRDRSGEIIFSQLNPAGSQRDVEGQPPFALVIGNATHVTVQYKGKVVELAQRSKDDVARLNLD